MSRLIVVFRCGYLSVNVNLLFLNGLHIESWKSLKRLSSRVRPRFLSTIKYLLAAFLDLLLDLVLDTLEGILTLVFFVV